MAKKRAPEPVVEPNWIKPEAMDADLWALFAKKLTEHIAFWHVSYKVMGGYCHKGDEYASAYKDARWTWEVTVVVDIPGEIAPYDDLYSVSVHRDGRITIGG